MSLYLKKRWKVTSKDYYFNDNGNYKNKNSAKIILLPSAVQMVITIIILLLTAMTNNDFIP